MVDDCGNKSLDGAEPTNDGLLSRFKLVTQTRQITEVCFDDQHKSCENPECECECHES